MNDSFDKLTDARSLFESYWRKMTKRLTGKVSLKPSDTPIGSVLLSYMQEPFLRKPDEPLSPLNSSYWECREIARLFLKRGFSVDVIQSNDNSFVPKKHYDIVVDIQRNLARLAPILKKPVIKVMHVVSSESRFQNQAEEKRLIDLEKRRGVRISPQRHEAPSNNIEVADIASGFGTETTFGTYGPHAWKIHRIPISTAVMFDFFEDKDFSSAKKHFIWFGGGGAVHKGLDLVLEIFAELPDLELTVAGPVGAEKDFMSLYKKELFETPNIHLVGRIKPDSKQFSDIAKSCAALIYPSCSEGQAGSVVTAMHAGIIPVVSKNSGVDVKDFGITLPSASKEEIKKAILEIANSDEKKLRDLSRKTWEHARANYTRETFSKAYNDFIDMVIALKNKK